MQFIPLCAFTIICSYSLVISAPINQIVSDSQEIKHEKAAGIASRLLKQITDEQLAGQSLDEGNLVPETQQIESDDEENIEYKPTIDDLYPYAVNTDIDDDYFPLASDRQLMKYLEEQLDFGYDLTPVIHTPIMDDSLMKAAADE